MVTVSKSIFNKSIELDQNLIKYERGNEAKLSILILCRGNFKGKESGQTEHTEQL